MASVLDSFRENFAERFAVLKYLVLTAPVYYLYLLYNQPSHDMQHFYTVAGVTLFFFFGFLVKITHNVITEEIQIVPNLNPLKLGFSAIKGIVSLAPITYAFYWVANYIISGIQPLIPNPPVLNTINYIIWFISATFILTSFLFFARKEHIFEPYSNPKLLLDKAGDLILSFVFLALQLLLVNIVSTVFLCYVLYVLFGFSQVTTFVITFCSVFNVGVIGHSLGQICCEVISYNDKGKHNSVIR